MGIDYDGVAGVGIEHMLRIVLPDILQGPAFNHEMSPFPFRSEMLFQYAGNDRVLIHEFGGADQVGLFR